MTPLTPREAQMLEALKLAEPRMPSGPDLGTVRAAIAACEPKPHVFERHEGVIPGVSLYCCGLSSDDPIHIKPNPRRWVVEESWPVCERTGEGPHGLLDVGGKKIPACIIREVKPITREEIQKALAAVPGLADCVSPRRASKFLIQLGIEVED